MDTRAAHTELSSVVASMQRHELLSAEVGWQLVALVRATLDALELERMRRRGGDDAWIQQQEQLSQLRRQRDFFLELMESLGQGVAVTDAQGCFVYVNAAYGRLLGYRPEDLIGKAPAEAMLQEHASLFSLSFTHGVPGEASSYETYLRRADGNQIYVVLTSVSRWRDDHMVGNVSLIVDLTEHKRRDVERDLLIAELEQLAATDELTGIYNRRYFFALADREVKRARRYRRPLSVIMLDIDHFKLVNDTYGHATGDCVLRAVAGLCRAGIRETDILGRYGGEEFSIVVQEADLSSARVVAERLREEVASAPIAAAGWSVPVTISMGIAELDEGASSLAALVGLADAALYRAKRTGRNRVVVR